jgi:hypothetical protein
MIDYKPEAGMSNVLLTFDSAVGLGPIFEIIRA